MKLNAYLIRSTLVGGLAGLLFGFNTAVIAGTTHLLTVAFQLTGSQLGFTVASALIGTIFGALFAGIPGQRLGRRDSLRIMAVMFVISAVGCAFAWNWYALLAFRFLCGLAIGGGSVLSPMYLAEIAPAAWRGRLVGAFQMNIVIGILLAYLSNYFIDSLHLGVVEWRWELGVALIPSLLFVIMLQTIGRSPRWLMMQDRVDEARAAVRAAGVHDPNAEIESIAASIHLDRHAVKEPLLSAKYRLPLFLAVTAAMFNQLTGINAVIYYVNDIFAAAGFSSLSGAQQAIYVGLANLIATVAALSVIDKLGRKTLLLIGAVGMAVCLFAVAVIFQTSQHRAYLLPLLLLYIVMFAISQGAVLWVFLGEILPTSIRTQAQSLATAISWLVNVGISWIFPIIALRHAASPFYFFGVMMVLQFVLVLAVYPETKGVTLEQMQQKLGIQ